MRELVMTAIFIVLNFLHAAQSHDTHRSDVIKRKQHTRCNNAILRNQPKRQRHFDDSHSQRDPNWKAGQAQRKQEWAIPKENVIEDNANGQRNKVGISVNELLTLIDQNNPASKEDKSQPKQQVIYKRKRRHFTQKIPKLRPRFFYNETINFREGS